MTLWLASVVGIVAGIAWILWWWLRRKKKTKPPPKR